MILKNNNLNNNQHEKKIEEYEFLDLKNLIENGLNTNNQESRRVVKKGETLASEKLDVQNYNMPLMKDVYLQEKKQKAPIIKKERSLASINQFQISPIVKEYRGIVDQEKEEYNIRFQREVNNKLNEVYEEWKLKGFEEGKKLAYTETKSILLQEVEKEIDQLKSIIEAVKNTEEEIIIQQKDQVVELIKACTKWILLKEIDRDTEYLPRLLEKLILELGTKDHLLIKVNKTVFDKMPEFIEMVEKKIGKLTNLRLEVDHIQDQPGIIIESLHGIIDGTFETQLKNLDSIFNQLTQHE